MNPFKKKKTPQTLQELQGEFNQIMFRLGDLHYRKSMIKTSLDQINNDIATLVIKADAMGVTAADIRKKMEAEVKAKVAEGEAK